MDDCVNDARSLSPSLPLSVSQPPTWLKNKVRLGVELTANVEELGGEEGQRVEVCVCMGGGAGGGRLEQEK